MPILTADISFFSIGILMNNHFRLFSFHRIASVFGNTALAVIVFASGTFFSGQHVAAQTIEWKTNLEQAQEQAKNENKLVLLHFTADWCHPCRALETFVFSSSRVQRAFAANVIAVKIDVDEHSELVKSYAVTGVPYDVAITPAGRIVSRRSSPRESLGYGDMLLGFGNTIQALQGGENTALTQNLNELKDKMAADHEVVENQSFTPLTPRHQAAEPSFESRELNRNNRNNRNFGPSAHGATGSKGPNALATSKASSQKKATISNAFVPASAKAKLLIPLAQNQATPQAAATKKVAPPVAPRRVINNRFQPTKSSDAVASSSNPANPVASRNHSLETLASLVSHMESSDPVTRRTRRSGATIPGAAQGRFQGRFQSKAPVSPPANSFALHGKCPVTLLKEGRWDEGHEKWGCVHRKRTYLFASEQYLRAFQKDPDAFSPLLAGYDPVIYEQTGKLIVGAEEHGVFMGKTPNQRVVLFSNAETRSEFQSHPHKYIRTIRNAMRDSGGASSTILR